jgi:hypothetical protein
VQGTKPIGSRVSEANNGAGTGAPGKRMRISGEFANVSIHKELMRIGYENWTLQINIDTSS